MKDCVSLTMCSSSFLCVLSTKTIHSFALAFPFFTHLFFGLLLALQRTKSKRTENKGAKAFAALSTYSLLRCFGSVLQHRRMCCWRSRRITNSATDSALGYQFFFGVDKDEAKHQQ
uniref:Uncharacterized protein n=1 Tax=Pediastrum duplex TaxID=3105 RepID=A0A2U8GIJ3_PEDDU|nr:hypothetical protein [Pediastrum duplex]